MSRYNCITSRLYQAGFTQTEAVQKGADATLFASLEVEFKGGSIPLHLILGFRKVEAYSCEYHRGGQAGKILRQIAKDLRNKT